MLPWSWPVVIVEINEPPARIAISRRQTGECIELKLHPLGQDLRRSCEQIVGNDAAHEILTVDPKNLIIALRIIEHLLVNIYILDSEAEGKLETIIKTPAKFIEILDRKLSGLSKGEEIPIAKIFGKDVRRFHGYLAAHEASLIAEITAGNYTKLRIGKVDNYAGSKDKLQHFIVS